MPDDIIGELEADAVEQVKANATARTAKREESAVVRALTDELGHVQALLGIKQGIDAARLNVPNWRIGPQGPAAHVGIVTAVFTDSHFDELIDAEQVEGVNCYNRAIAELRLRTWAEKVVELPRQYMRGVKFEGLVIPALGDVFSGEIHAERGATNEATTLESVQFWIEKMIAVAELFDREFRGHVEFDCVVGNHGRNSEKPIYKNRPQNNFEWLFWSLVRDRLKDRRSRVTVNVAPSMKVTVPIYGRAHRLEHGDEMRGGSGISGALAPLMLGQHRTTRQQVSVGRSVALQVIGHWHQALDLPGIICGGTLKGMDEHAWGRGYPFEPAQQALWITTPERGKTLSMPIIVQDREAEGW